MTGDVSLLRRLDPRTALARIPAEERARLREGIVFCVKVFVATRIGLLLLGLIGVSLFRPEGALPVPDWPARPYPDPGWHVLFTAWERWDALWYLRIAASGYALEDGSASFFPLYPLLTRAVAWWVGWHPLAGAFIVSNLSYFGAMCVLYFLTVTEVSAAAARKTVLYISLFPAAFFFFAPYTESLFLFLTVSCIWSARRDRWWLAGIAGLAVGLTRITGIFLTPALMVIAVEARGAGAMRRRFALSLGALAGFLGYLGYWWWRSGSGDPLFAIHSGEVRTGGGTFVAPWTSVIKGAKDALAWLGQFYNGLMLIDLLVVSLALVAAVLVTIWFRPTYAVLSWGMLLLPLAQSPNLNRPLLGIERYVLPIFPLFWALAKAVERGWISHNLVLVVEVAGLALLTASYVNWGIN